MLITRPLSRSMKFKSLVVGPSTDIFKITHPAPQTILMCRQGWEPLNREGETGGEERARAKSHEGDRHGRCWNLKKAGVA